MLEKNAVKFRFLFLVIFVLINSGSIEAEILSYPVKVSSSLLYHHGSFYGVSTQNNVIKQRSSGSITWSVPKLFPKESSISIKFNSLFFINESGILQVFDLDYGFSKWALKDKTIKAYKVHHPFIFYLSTTGKMGALDFETGAVVWERSAQGVRDFYFFPKRQQVLLVTKTKISLVNAFSGEQESTMPFKKRVVKWISSQSELRFQTDDGFYETDLKKVSSTFKIADKHHEGSVFQGRYYVVYDEEEKALLSYHIGSGDLNWKKPVEKDDDPVSIWFSDTYVMLLSPGDKVGVYSLGEGELLKTVTLPSEIKKEAISRFFFSQSKVIMLSKNRMYHLI